MSMATQDLVVRQVPQDIPALVALQKKRQWVNWSLEATEKGKFTKVPYHPIGRKASPTNPEVWSSYESVQAAFDASQLNGRKLQGVGFVFNKEHVGIDLDHCVDENGNI